MRTGRRRNAFCVKGEHALFLTRRGSGSRASERARVCQGGVIRRGSAHRHQQQTLISRSIAPARSTLCQQDRSASGDARCPSCSTRNVHFSFPSPPFRFTRSPERGCDPSYCIPADATPHAPRMSVLLTISWESPTLQLENKSCPGDLRHAPGDSFARREDTFGQSRQARILLHFDVAA